MRGLQFKATTTWKAFVPDFTSEILPQTVRKTEHAETWHEPLKYGVLALA